MALEHPMVRQRGFVIESPPLLRFEKTVFDLLRRGELGLCAYGAPRVGKTTAGLYIQYRLTAGKVAACRIVGIERQQGARVDRADFWQCFVENSLTSMKTRSPAAARKALISGLAVEADALNTRKVVLAVDEAQYLTVQHFAMLKLLLEDLINLGLSPFLLLLAQPEILNRPSELLKHNYHDLVDRFFIHWHQMKGLALAEFPDFLASYDTLTWKAEEGGPAESFTQYFAPRLAPEKGLKGLAPYFEDRFRQVHRELGGGKTEEFETKFIVTAVRIFLLNVHDNPGLLKPQLVSEAIKAAIESCGIYESRRSVGNALVLNVPNKS
jgi:hypothetical protein